MEFNSSHTAIAILCSYAVVASLERIPQLRLRESRFWRPALLTDVGWYVAAITITLALGPLLQGLAQARASIGSPGFDSLDMSPIAMVVAATVLYDLGATVAHRALHRYDMLWRLHKVHHSSRVLDWLATTRAHVLEHLARGIPTQAFLYALGVPAWAVATAIAVYAAFATLGHSNLRLNLAWLEWLFVTPRIHHLHHAPETTHRNFGTVLTIWDRALGQLIIRKANANERLGVPEEVEAYPQTWIRQLAEPFRG